MITVFTEKITPRIKYIFSLILVDVLGTKVTFTQDESIFEDTTATILNYSKRRVNRGVTIIPSDLLFESDIFEQEIYMEKHEGVPVFFNTQGNSSLPFDPFATSFYTVTRYEEYLPYIPDEHGRFPPSESLAYKEGFLDKPIVNLWARMVKNKMLSVYPEIEFAPKPFSYLSTIDIDNLYAYRSKGGFRTIGGFLKDFSSLSFRNAWHRLLTILSIVKDPYDTMDYQAELQEKLGFDCQYFMLFSSFGQFDRNVPFYSHSMHSAVKGINDFAPVGIHPSYKSNQSEATLEKEIKGLAKVLNVPVAKSRQHFLMLRFPSTYRNLMKLGITEDYSMGYASELGFRAGIAHPFDFYDLEMEVKRPLKIFPFQVMEGALMYHKKTPVSKAWPLIKSQIDAVKEVDGQFVSVWHHRIFSEEEPEWKGWTGLYQKMISYALDQDSTV